MAPFTLTAAIILAGMWVSIGAAYFTAKVTYSQEIEAHSLAYVNAVFKPCLILSVICLFAGVMLDIYAEPVTLYQYSLHSPK